MFQGSSAIISIPYIPKQLLVPGSISKSLAHVSSEVRVQGAVHRWIAREVPKIPLGHLWREVKKKRDGTKMKDYYASWDKYDAEAEVEKLKEPTKPRAPNPERSATGRRGVQIRDIHAKNQQSSNI